MHDIPDNEYTNFNYNQKILKMIIETKDYMCYPPSKRSGIMYYNTSIADEKCISLIYKIQNKMPYQIQNA